MSDERKISEMRNLGPACEADLNAVGICTAQDVIDRGVEVTFMQMLEGRKKTGRSTKCCNAAYLYAIHGAIHDIDWRKVPVRKKQQYKRLTAELRSSGRFS
ncbi:MAG: hypothetical protein HKN47_06505 [Pirellulaceae bacterium]|nr:hypothetical protein [Pirellulaceae bacterium]